MQSRLVVLLACVVWAGCGPVIAEDPGRAVQLARQSLSSFTGPTNSGHAPGQVALLPDGRVLARSSSGSETYSRTTDTWTPTGPVVHQRFWGMLVPLADGRVLSFGSSTSQGAQTAELFDPQTNTWSLTGSLNAPRDSAPAVRLADGRVLVVGGPSSTTSAEVFDPATGTWTLVPGAAKESYRYGTATLLADGRVLLVGANRVEVFAPASGTFTEVLGTSGHRRSEHAAHRLPDGRVLLAGGTSSTVSLFDPATLGFTSTGAMATANRRWPASAQLSDGSVLVIGGSSSTSSATIATVERYYPETGLWGQFETLLRSRESAGAAVLASGEVLVVGGWTRNASGVASIIDRSEAAERLESGGTCEPLTCTSQNASCGTMPDGCGQMLDCGTCGPGLTCSTSRQCVCAPRTCSELGRVCGSVSDGCGGTLQCGTCAGGTTCDANGACVAAPGQAVYDAALRAPACLTEGSACDSGTLVNGRAQLGPEQNAPNTLGATCADGTSGTYHVDESLDRLRVVSVDGGPLSAGKAVRIEATVWAYSSFSSDALDLYSAANADSPSWTFIGTLKPTASGSQVLSTTFTLPSGSKQAIRGAFRYGGSAAPCASGGYNDRDDLVFHAATPVDSAPPSVDITSPASASTVTGNVTVQASATDDVGVTRVEFYVAPNTEGATPTLVGTDTTAPYSVTWDSRQPPHGAVLLTARAYDATGKVTVSSSVLVVADNTGPAFSSVSPAYGTQVSGFVRLAAEVDDYSGVSSVSFSVNGTTLGSDATAPYEVTWNTTTVANGTYTVTATAWDRPGNVSSTSWSLVVANPTSPSAATYDATWKVPACSVASSACDSGTLLRGRAHLGPESNAPNTLNSACSDGTSGTFHSDESLDRLKVTALDGGNIRLGATVRITADVWAWGTSDVLDIWVSPTVSSPTWTRVASLSPTTSGAQTFSVDYTVGARTRHVVRGVFRYGGSAVLCPGGSYDDVDDLIVAIE